MTDRITPNLINEAKKKNPYRVTRKEIDDFLSKKGKPLDKKKLRKRTRQMLMKRKEKRAKPRGRDISFSQADANWQFFYGEVRLGGIVTFMYVHNAKTLLSQILSLSCIEIDSVQKLYLEGKEVVFGASPDARWSIGDFQIDGASKVFLDSSRVGTASQTAQPDLITQMSAIGEPDKWTSNHRLRGHAHVYLVLVYHRNLFSEGIPAIEFLARGKKVYDPRTTTTYYTNNACLVIADYMTNSQVGFGLSWSDFDEDSIIENADICDENVPLAVGGTEKRYVVNAKFTADQSKEEVLEEMLSACAGVIVYSGGKYKIIVGKYRAPTVHLTEDDLAGTVEIEYLQSHNDTFNTVKGEFVDSENGYTVTDFPAYSDLSAVNEDGREIVEDVSFPCTTKASTAQRLAKILIKENRNQVKLKASWGLRAFELEYGDYVQVTLPRYGISTGLFKVLNNSFAFDTEGCYCDLFLTSATVNDYNWVTEEIARIPAGTLTLPSPNVALPPTGLTAESGTDQLLIRNDGTILTRVLLEWTLPEDGFVTEDGKYEIQYKKASDSNYLSLGLVDGSNSNYIVSDVKDGLNYNFRIRSINGVGVASGWTTITHTVVGKSEAPSDVVIFNSSFSNFEVLLSWQLITDADVKGYVLRRGGVDFDSASDLAMVSGDKYLDSYQSAGVTKYWIKAIDTSGNLSENALLTEVEILTPNSAINLTKKVVDNNVLLFWEAGAQTTFPVERYNIYKGADFGSAELIGSAGSTFHSLFENVGGVYTYWVTAVDTAGNESEEEFITVDVYNPPDFVLRSDLDITFSGGTFDSSGLIDDDLVIPINETETWEEHYINNSYDTAQEQIDAGYPYYMQPVPLAGSWEKEIDYGAVLPPSLVNLIFSELAISGSVDYTITISAKEDVLDPWTDFVGLSQFISIPFRYVKYRIEAIATDSESFSVISNLNSRIEVKKQTDGGSSESSSSAPIIVTFNKDFIDVINIVVTPASTTGQKLTPVIDYDWNSPDTDQFEVLIYDVNGTQVQAQFSWTAEGVVRV